MPVAGQALAIESAHAASSEYEVKATFIHNFAQFTDWPRDSFATEESPIRIGIMGQGPIDESLVNLSGKEVKKRFLEVSRVSNVNDASGYHIVFINPSEKDRISSILHSFKNTGILTIGDMPGFVDECGIINFYLKDDRVRFEINVSAATRENHRLSSKLLSLARIVIASCD